MDWQALLVVMLTPLQVVISATDGTNAVGGATHWWEANEWQSADNDYTHAYEQLGVRTPNTQSDVWRAPPAEGSGNGGAPGPFVDELVEGSGFGPIEGYGPDDEDSIVEGSGFIVDPPEVPWTSDVRVVEAVPPLAPNSPRPPPPPEATNSWWSMSTTGSTFTSPTTLQTQTYATSTTIKPTTTPFHRPASTTVATSTSTRWQVAATTSRAHATTSTSRVTTSTQAYDPFSWSTHEPTKPAVVYYTDTPSIVSPPKEGDHSIYETPGDEPISPRQRLRELFNRPGVWAAMIGGAVVGILVAVTLVSFIVYRMRKKDEGSYALDESASPGQYGYAYSKAPAKEFYA